MNVRNRIQNELDIRLEKPNMLHPGLYEQIISKAMDRALASTDRRSQTAPIDPAKASKVLAQYVAEVVEHGLETLRDRGGDLHAQVALTENGDCANLSTGMAV